MRVSFPNDGKPQGSPEGVLLCSGTSRLFIHIIASPAKALAALECPSLPGPMIAHRATAQASQGTPLFPSISFWSPCSVRLGAFCIGCSDRRIYGRELHNQHSALAVG